MRSRQEILIIPAVIINPTYRKDFEWTRIFDMKYDITRQLKIDFTSTNIARIDEPEGPVDKDRYRTEYEIWRDSVMTNIKSFGRTTSYNHFFNITYNIPINKLPLLSWVTANARIGADYAWLAGAIYPDSMKINLGNSIRNHSELTFSATANLASLYSKSKFLKNIENNTRPDAVQRMQTEFKTVTFSRSNINFRENIVRSITHNLKTKDVKVRIVKKDGAEVKGKLEILSENRMSFTSAETAEGTTVSIEGRIPKKRNPVIITGEYVLRALMGVRSVSMTYTKGNGTVYARIPPGGKFPWHVKSQQCIGAGTAVHTWLQRQNFFNKAVSNRWVTTDSLLNTPAMYNNGKIFPSGALSNLFPD